MDPTSNQFNIHQTPEVGQTESKAQTEGSHDINTPLPLGRSADGVVVSDNIHHPQVASDAAAQISNGLPAKATLPLNLKGMSFNREVSTALVEANFNRLQGAAHALSEVLKK